MEGRQHPQGARRLDGDLPGGESKRTCTANGHVVYRQVTPATRSQLDGKIATFARRNTQTVDRIPGSSGRLPALPYPSPESPRGMVTHSEGTDCLLAQADGARQPSLNADSPRGSSESEVHSAAED